jgi:hypothetical protein
MFQEFLYLPFGLFICLPKTFIWNKQNSHSRTLKWKRILFFVFFTTDRDCSLHSQEFRWLILEFSVVYATTAKSEWKREERWKRKILMVPVDIENDLIVEVCMKSEIWLKQNGQWFMEWNENGKEERKNTLRGVP